MTDPTRPPDPPTAPASRASPRFSGLLAGFAVLIMLMLLIALVGIMRVEQQQEGLERIVHDRMVRLTLGAHLYRSARERTVSLQKMGLLEDPFERDEEWMRFNRMGAEFARARAQLLALGLSETERALLEEQGRRTAVAVPLQLEVADLFSAGRRREAMRLLATKAIAAQDAVLEQLHALNLLQETLAGTAAEEARTANRRTQLWIVLLTSLAVAIGVGVALVTVRVTRRSAAAVFRERQQALVTLGSIGDAVMRTDHAGRVEYLNPVAERMTGWDLEAARGQPVTEVFRAFDDVQHERPVDPTARLAISGDPLTVETGDLLLGSRSGEERAVELSVAPILDPAGRSGGTVLVFRDVTELRALSRELAFQASHDMLTNLPNRRAFEHELQRMLLEARAGSQHALCYVDLDLFKTVNDTCGHLAGDELLRQLAGLLRLRIRRRDLLARLGGDEFGILLADCPLSRAEELAHQICEAVRSFRFAWDGRTFDVGASIGVVSLDAAAGAHEILRLADLACYSAKDLGRGRVYVAQPGDDTIAAKADEIEWMHRVRAALEENRLCLYAQEIAPLSAQAGETRYELLLRLRAEDGTIVAPMTFLPAAEHYNLMPAIDRWVVREALAFLGARHANGGAPVPQVNINLSGQSVGDAGFLGFLRQELTASTVPLDHLCFEITETAAVANLAQARQFIASLKSLGVRFALDDFGSGMSSFAYLKNLPVDFIKIDGAFIRDITHSRADAGMVAAVQKLAELLDIRTVAEYVENDEIRALVRTLGVDAVQGYGVGFPGPINDVIRGHPPSPVAD